MRTRLNGGHELTMTPQEAEAVLNLVNQRQQELDHLRARTTVQDIAEATAMPASEIESLLAHVRHTGTIPTAQPQKVRRHPFLITFAALAGLGLWCAVLAGVFEMGMQKGRTQQWMSLQYMRGMQDIGRGKVIVDMSPISAKNIPVGVSVTFDSGYTVDGEQKGNFYNEEYLAGAIQKIVDNRLDQRPESNGNQTAYDYEKEQKLGEVLRTGKVEGYESYFAFEDLRVTVNGVELPVTKIPIERYRYGQGSDEIRRERERRIGLLANKMVRMLKEGTKS